MVMTTANSIDTCLKYDGTQSRDRYDHILENRFLAQQYFCNHCDRNALAKINTKVLQNYASTFWLCTQPTNSLIN